MAPLGTARPAHVVTRGRVWHGPTPQDLDTDLARLRAGLVDPLDL